MESVEARLQRVIKSLCGGNRSEFCCKTGILNSTLSRLISGQINFTAYYAQKIANAFPETDISYLISGEGYPGDISIELMREKYTAEIKKLTNENETLKKELETLKLVIARLVRK